MNRRLSHADSGSGQQGLIASPQRRGLQRVRPMMHLAASHSSGRDLGEEQVPLDQKEL